MSWVVNNKDTIIFTQRPCWTPQYVYENMTPTVKHVFAVKEWLQTYSVKVYSLSKSWRLQFFKYFLDNCKFHCILEISSIQILNFTTLNLQYNSSLNLKSSYKKSVISNFLLKMVSNFTMSSFGSRSNLFVKHKTKDKTCYTENEVISMLGSSSLSIKTIWKKVMSVWFLICIVKFLNLWTVMRAGGLAP